MSLNRHLSRKTRIMNLTGLILVLEMAMMVSATIASDSARQKNRSRQLQITRTKAIKKLSWLVSMKAQMMFCFPQQI